MITYIIIGITVAVSFFAWDKKSWLDKLMMNPYRINKQNEYYRFISSGFVHVNHIHLLMNMFSFYFFGLSVERVFKNLFGVTMGGVYFIALYFIAMIVSDLPTYLKFRKNPGYNSLGASGAVSAVIFAFIIFRPLDLICIFIALCMPGFILGVAYILYSYFQGRKSQDNINHDAHLYGALFGLIFCIIIYPASIPGFIEQVRSWDFLDKIF